MQSPPPPCIERMFALYWRHAGRGSHRADGQIDAQRRQRHAVRLVAESVPRLLPSVRLLLRPPQPPVSRGRWRRALGQPVVRESKRSGGPAGRVGKALVASRIRGARHGHRPVSTLSKAVIGSRAACSKRCATTKRPPGSPRDRRSSFATSTSSQRWPAPPASASPSASPPWIRTWRATSSRPSRRRISACARSACWPTRASASTSP